MNSNKRVIRMMGTVIELYVEHENSEVIIDELIARLKTYEKRFSANDSNSELMKINHNAGTKKVIVHRDLFNLIEIGKEQSCVKGSLLNIAIGPLVQTWRIGFKDAKVPSDHKIRNLLKTTNPNKISLDKSDFSVFLEENGMLIDLGSLAKGYIADLLIEYSKSLNVQSAMINLGGNIVVLGESKNHNNGNWRIGIQNPNKLENNNITVVEVKNQSIVTSGIYERYLNNDGHSYHHILDPKTGYPVKSDVISLTIVSDESLDGEIWTTRLFGKESNEILRLINSIEGIECLIVTDKGKLLRSEKLYRI